MTPRNGVTIDLTLTTEFDLRSVGNNDYESVLTRAPIQNPKPSHQPAAVTLSYSICTPRTDSTSTLSPSAVLPAVLTLYFKSHKKIQ